LCRREATIVSAGGETDKKHVVMQPKAKASVCKEHDVELLFYCETCEELVCKYCVAKDHNGHEYDTVKVIASKHRNVVEKMATDIVQAYDNTQNMIKMIKQGGEKVFKEINELYDELFLKLKEQEDLTKQQARDAVTQKNESLQKQQIEIAHAQTDLEALEQLKCSIEESSGQEVLLAIRQLIDHIKQLSVKYKELTIEPVHSATMEFVPTKQSFPLFGQLFTNIDPATVKLPSPVEPAITTKHHNDRFCSRGSSQVSMQLESIMREVTVLQVRYDNNGSHAALYANQNIGNLMCKQHNNKLLFYCKVCQELVCMYCTVEDHAGHEHDTVELMASKYHNKLQELTAPVKEMYTNLDRAQDNIEKTIKMITQSGEEVNEEIVQYYSKLFQKLEEQKDQTKAQASIAITQQKKAFEKQLNKLKHIQETLLIEELKDFIEKNPDQEEFSAEWQVIDRMKQLHVKCKELNSELVCATTPPSTMEFVTTKQPFPLFSQLFTNVDPATCEIVNFPNPIHVGEVVEFTIITRYHNDHCCSRGGSQVSVQLESSSGEATAIQVTDNNDGSYVASFASGYIGKVKISVSINGWQIKGSPCSVNM